MVYESRFLEAEGTLYRTFLLEPRVWVWRFLLLLVVVVLKILRFFDLYITTLMKSKLMLLELTNSRYTTIGYGFFVMLTL